MRKTYEFSRFKWPQVLLIASMGAGLSGCGSDYQATILETSYGIPHVVAQDYAGLGYGQGYVVARDNVCVLAEQLVKVRSERSQYFGPGQANANVISDFGYKILNVYANAEQGLAKIDSRSRDMIQGYAEGYNKYLSEKGLDNLPAACKSQPWVKPITATDMFAYSLSVALLASGEPLIPALVAAMPPSQAPLSDAAAALPDFVSEKGVASNAWGLGKDKTTNGRGALLGNPHFPHYGPLRFYEAQLTIPGELNVYGASLIGGIGINVGFNEHLGWSHTVAASTHFNLYQMTLAENNPTTYVYDGMPRAMESSTFTVQINVGSGVLIPKSLTFYRTHLGPVVVVPGMLEWSQTKAYVLADANDNKIDFVDHWLAMNRAKNLDEFQQAFKDYHGIPWVNTVYADKKGHAFYIDGTPVPNFHPAVLTAFRNNPLAWGTFKKTGLMIVDGSSSVTAWQGKGLVPYEQAPKLLRSDYVANHNDGPWLTNPAEKLEGFSFLYGPEREQQSLRTRLGLSMLQDSAGSDGRFSTEEMRAALFNNRQYAGELLRQPLLDLCWSVGSVEMTEADGSQRTVSLQPACQALAAWDGRMNVDSIGAHLFQEFILYAQNTGLDLFANGFDVGNPIATPNTLKIGSDLANDPVVQALATVVAYLQDNGVVLDAPLGAVQYVERQGERYPWSGGEGNAGTFNAMGYSERFRNRSLLPFAERAPLLNSAGAMTADGLPINRGTSFAFVLGFDNKGPRAKGIVTYSQSMDPESSHYKDQTERYSLLGGEDAMRPMLFWLKDIIQDASLRVSVIDSTLESSPVTAEKVDAGGCRQLRAWIDPQSKLTEGNFCM